MLRSLYSGVAGLKTHNIKMDVIGNNIANVNTYGFKASRVTFKDVYYQTTTSASDADDNSGGSNTSQVGYGSMVGSIDVLHGGAGYAPTGSGMDLYMEGQGFLIAQDGAGNEVYTRVGVTDFDGDGNLVDSNGKFICGYPIKRDENGDIVYQTNEPVGAKTVVSGVEFNFGEANGDSLNDYNINYAYKSDLKDPYNGDGDAEKVAVARLDGKTITIYLDAEEYKPTDDGTITAMNAGELAGLTNTALSTMFDALNDDTNAEYDKSFPNIADPTATFASAIVDAELVDFSEPGTITGGVDEFTNSPEIDTSGVPRPIKLPGTTSRPNEFGVPTYEEDDVMELEGIGVGSNGVITGTDTEGNVIQLGQIVLASIPNPSAMSMEGSSYYKAGANTGNVTYNTPGAGVVGGIKSGGLEMSNVDLSTEFADMITTQRGFQANSRIITVGDEMLQELISMKR